MAKSSTTWQAGRSGNPSGRPRTGESIVKALADELGKRGQKDKLARELVKRALAKDSDWRLIMAIYDYLFKVYHHESIAEIEKRMDEIEERLNETQNTSY